MTYQLNVESGARHESGHIVTSILYEAGQFIPSGGCTPLKIVGGLRGIRKQFRCQLNALRVRVDLRLPESRGAASTFEVLPLVPLGVS
jgi:hypothetical protein